MTDRVVRLTFTGELYEFMRPELHTGMALRITDEEARKIEDGMPIVVTVNGQETFGVVWSVASVPAGVSAAGDLTRDIQIRLGQDLYDHARKLQQDTPHD